MIREELAHSVPTAIRQIAVEKTEIFSGPIPSPAACEGYENVLSGFTDRALKIAEKAQDADIAAAKRKDLYLLAWGVLSLLVAFALAGGVIAGGVYLLANDKNVAGFSILISGLSTMILAVIARRSAKPE